MLANKISGVEMKTQNKTVSPQITSQIIYPDEDHDALSYVTINAVTSEIDSFIKPEYIRQDVEILGVKGNLNPYTNDAYIESVQIDQMQNAVAENIVFTNRTINFDLKIEPTGYCKFLVKIYNSQSRSVRFMDCNCNPTNLQLSSSKLNQTITQKSHDEMYLTIYPPLNCEEELNLNVTIELMLKELENLNLQNKVVKNIGYHTNDSGYDGLKSLTVEGGKIEYIHRLVIRGIYNANKTIITFKSEITIE